MIRTRRNPPEADRATAQVLWRRWVYPVILATMLGPVAARADDVETLQTKVDRLEQQVKLLQDRADRLAPASAPRRVLVVDPVFIGAGGAKPNSLSMDNMTINCPARSFVTAVQVLKTGNTVSQIRYACRSLE